MKDFSTYRKNIIGNDLTFQSPYGEKKVLYADWIASGRLYKPIEDFIASHLGPYVANTHTETTLTGTTMTEAYHRAQSVIKDHVNAGPDDVLMAAGFGMTEVINKLQRIMGLRVPEQYKEHVKVEGDDRPLVIITHMEHHSNQISWNECEVDVRLIRRTDEGLPDLAHLQQILDENKTRKTKIGSFSACSNVTGIMTPYHQMAEIMHKNGGLCFIDFAASAPYVGIDMHPQNPLQKLDVIFFSPHKFLGGPGAPGIMIFDKSLYKLKVPDRPGGGTVLWTNPWGEQRYFDNVEVREDGGTPGFLQTIKAALAILLKEDMGVEHIMEREHHYVNRVMDGLAKFPCLHMLEENQRNRIGIVSFYCPGKHFNLIVKLLNDRFGIQTRGGCSCAGTYGHILLHVDREKSKEITYKINHGDLSDKPGWVRVSLHPTMNEDELDYLVASIGDTLENYQKYAEDYVFDHSTAEFYHKNAPVKPVELKRDFLSRLTTGD